MTSAPFERLRRGAEALGAAADPAELRARLLEFVRGEWGCDCSESAAAQVEGPAFRLPGIAEGVAAGTIDREAGVRAYLPDATLTTEDLCVVRELQRVIDARRLVWEAQARARRLLSFVTHELRNPLAAIRMNAQLLERSIGSAPGPAREQLDRIARSTQRLDELIEERVAAEKAPKA